MPMALRPMLTPTTFDTERLWRRNLRDNDGDGEITGNDGVDLNRNRPTTGPSTGPTAPTTSCGFEDITGASARAAVARGPYRPHRLRGERGGPRPRFAPLLVVFADSDNSMCAPHHR
jgi:hypothetical protein